MTLEMKNISGTLEQMNDLFENGEPSQRISVRHFGPASKDSNNFDIIIRCNEDVAEKIKRKKSINSIVKALN